MCAQLVAAPAPGLRGRCANICMSAGTAAIQHSTLPTPAQTCRPLRLPRCARAPLSVAAFRPIPCSVYRRTYRQSQAGHIAGGTPLHRAAYVHAAAADSAAAFTSSSDDDVQQQQQQYQQRRQQEQHQPHAAGDAALEHERPVLGPPRPLPPPPAAEGLLPVLLYSFRICLTERWALPRLAAVFGLLAVSRIAGASCQLLISAANADRLCSEVTVSVHGRRTHTVQCHPSAIHTASGSAPKQLCVLQGSRCRCTSSGPWMRRGRARLRAPARYCLPFVLAANNLPKSRCPAHCAVGLLPDRFQGTCLQASCPAVQAQLNVAMHATGNAAGAGDGGRLPRHVRHCTRAAAAHLRPRVSCAMPSMQLLDLKWRALLGNCCNRNYICLASDCPSCLGDCHDLSLTDSITAKRPMV